MLKGIDPIIPPVLLKAMCEMGHGDTLVIADANFPAETVGRDAVVVRCDGHGAKELLKPILDLMPLDQYDGHPVTLMEVVPGDPVDTPVWRDYERLVKAVDRRGGAAFGHLERFAFYEEARRAHCVIATGERAQYANLILRKGVVYPD